MTFVLCVRLSAECKATAWWDCLVVPCYTQISTADQMITLFQREVFQDISTFFPISASQKIKNLEKYVPVDWG